MCLDSLRLEKEVGIAVFESAADPALRTPAHSAVNKYRGRKGPTKEWGRRVLSE